MEHILYTPVSFYVHVGVHVVISWSTIVRMAQKKMAVTLNVYKMICSNSALCVGISLYEPYLSFSSVFISNKTVAREHS